MSDDKTTENNIELNEIEKEAFAEGLAESAILKDQLEEFGEMYDALDKKYPLKNKKGKSSS